MTPEARPHEIRLATNFGIIASDDDEDGADRRHLRRGQGKTERLQPREELFGVHRSVIRMVPVRWASA